MASQGMAERYALLIGVGDYNDTELKDLAYSENDVTELAATLLEKGYKKGNVILMTDTQAKEVNLRWLPTGKNIRKEIDGFLKIRDPEDTVIFAFTGHGVQFKGKDEHYFCPRDAEIEDRDTLVSISKIFDALENCPASGKVLLVDACRDNPLSNISKSAGRIELEAVSNRVVLPPGGGTVAIFSCTESQQSWEVPKLKHGAFFYHVNKALAGEADLLNDGDITFQELATYSINATETYVFNNLGKAQSPALHTRDELNGIVLIDGDGPEPVFTNTFGTKLNLIPRGKFMMGSNPTAKGARSDEAWHRVEISKSFYMGATEVTQDQWFSIMKTKPWKEGDKILPLCKSNPRNPATYINWEEANEFCRRLSEIEKRVYRLPTEAEWEYACRANEERRGKYSFGNNESLLSQHAWFHDNEKERTVDKTPQEVGLKPPNGFGLYDMHGNVCEWCSDWMDRNYYLESKSIVKDPQGPDSGKKRVMRGGGFTMPAQNCRSAKRFQLAPSHSDAEYGFRIVLELETAEK